MKKITISLLLFSASILGAQVAWTGAGGNNLWSDANNWSSAPNLPTSSDDVSIGTNSITIDIDAVCNNFTAGNLFSGGNITINDNASLHVNGNYSNIRGLVTLNSSSNEYSSIKIDGNSS